MSAHISATQTPRPALRHGTYCQNHFWLSWPLHQYGFTELPLVTRRDVVLSGGGDGGRGRRGTGR